MNVCCSGFDLAEFFEIFLTRLQRDRATHYSYIIIIIIIIIHDSLSRPLRTDIIRDDRAARCRGVNVFLESQHENNSAPNARGMRVKRARACVHVRVFTRRRRVLRVEYGLTRLPIYTHTHTRAHKNDNDFNQLPKTMYRLNTTRSVTKLNTAIREG